MPDFLLIKTSSLGDVLHNFPAVTDLCAHFPDARITWVVEESFAELPFLHPKVGAVLPVALRRWRKQGWRGVQQLKAALTQIRHHSCEFAIDSQGLMKSALFTRAAQGLRCGYAWDSAREPLASLAYTKRIHVAKDLHAVERNRQLMAGALGYRVEYPPEYGLAPPDLDLPWLGFNPIVVLLHATSRDDKLWPEGHWVALGRKLLSLGLHLVLPWGNDKERLRAQRLEQQLPGALVTPKLSLTEAATLLGQARAVIGVDTGLAHLAAALNIPTIGIYTATDPGLTGLYAGKRAVNLGGKQQIPSVAEVLATLQQLLSNA